MGIESPSKADEADISAVLVTVPPVDAVTATLSVIEAEAPGANDPTDQIPVTGLNDPVPVALTKVTPRGNWSRTCTPVAVSVDAAAFVTLKV